MFDLAMRKIGKQFIRGVAFYFYCKFVKIIGLKTPANYSHQFSSLKILVLLCEGPEPNIFMIPGFLTPGNLYLWI